nr:putative ribonuclease H-like domain-containing protein [Tanacetum cinerariifolium]
MEHSNPTLAKIPIVIEFRDSYVAPQNDAATGSASEGTATKKGRTVAVTTEDMQKRRNDVKARTTLLLALPDEHQLRFSKYKTTQELWAAILKTFGGNEATKKTKKNLLKQQYGNFKAKEWLMQTIVWRNRSDLDTMSLDDLYNHLKVYEPEVQKKSKLNSQNMAFISSAKNSSGNGKVNTASIPTASTQVSPAGPNVATASISLDTTCTYIASQSNGSQIKYKDINQIDEDDIEEIDIKWNMALLSMTADIYSKKTGKKISILGTDVAGFDKSKVECFNCHKMGHFARECRAPISQERGRRENYRQGSKEEEHTPNALMAIDGVGWDWSFMENEEENHALVANEEAPTEFALMAKSSSDNEVFDNSLYSKACLSQVEARLVEFKSQEIKFSKKEKGDLDSKLTGFQSASKDLDNLLGSQRNDKNKEDLGYSAVPPPPAQVYSPPKKDMSWTGLLEFADDTITDYSRPSPAIESNSDDLQNRNPSVTKTGVSSSTILSKPAITFVKSADRPTKTKTDKVETTKKPAIKYAEMYRKTSKRSNVIREKLLRPQLVRFGSIIRTQLTKGNSQNNIDDKGYWDSGCSRHMTGNISYLSDYEPFDGGYVTPRQHNMYSIDLNNVVPHKDLTCLVAKAAADECMLWHRRLGHLNIKTMNRLVRHNLVRGLPSKCFDNDHTCVACLKGKQHKASCKTNLVNSVTKPLHTLHMDLFGPTSVSSLNHKWYCLVVTDDFSRFTWTFFLKTKDETSSILKNFITEIEKLKDLKVKIIRCDNGGKFRNKEMNDFCSRKGIKREFSNARTPQQIGVAERRNRTLIEATRTMLADAKLPVTFWAEAVNIACYVQNRVLVNKFQNKTPYELFNVRTPAIGFVKSFGCHVMILNTLDHLGKFEAKGDKGLCREFEALMHEKFQMSAMGELNFFLGLQVLQKKDGIFLSQDKYVGDILKKFGYSDVISANTPMDKENPWGKDETRKDVDLHLYRSMIGSLMYLTASRPDIMFATIMATSTTKTEYVADASGRGQVLWIQNQLLDYRLAFYDYHNMIAILEKYEHNANFHQIVDFVEASYLRVNSPSYSRRIVPLFPTMLVTMGEGSGTPTEPQHTPSPEAQQTSPTATSSPLLPPVTTATITTVIPTDIPQLRQYTRRARIAQSSSLPPIADEPASPIRDDSQEISALKARIKRLEDRDGGDDVPSGEDAIIKGKRLEIGEEACIERSTEKGNDDTEKMVNVLTSLDATSVLSSGVQVSVSPAAEVATVSVPPATISVPTGSGMVLTASLIFSTATVTTPYSRRKGKEKIVESKMPKKKKLQEQMDVQMARQLEEEMARDA